MRLALVVIEMLNDFILSGAPLEVPENRSIIPALQQRLTEARVEQTPVIFVSDAHVADDREFERMGWPPHAVAGTPGPKSSTNCARCPAITWSRKPPIPDASGRTLNPCWKSCISKNLCSPVASLISASSALPPTP